jgi:hypothetical protein
VSDVVDRHDIFEALTESDYSSRVGRRPLIRLRMISVDANSPKRVSNPTVASDSEFR